MNQDLIFSYFKKLQKPVRILFIALTVIGIIGYAFGVYFSLFLHPNSKSIGSYIFFTISLVELFLLLKFLKIGLVGFPIAVTLGYLLYTVQFLRDWMGFVGPQTD